jgi:hypothetical protein
MRQLAKCLENQGRLSDAAAMVAVSTASFENINNNNSKNTEDDLLLPTADAEDELSASVTVGDSPSVTVGDGPLVGVDKSELVAVSDSSSNSVSDSASVAVGDSPSNPVSDSVSVAVGDSPSNPIGDSPSVAVGDSPSNTVGDSPSVAVGDSPFNTVVDSPSVGVGNSTSVTVGDSALVGVGDSPPVGVGDSPSVVAGDSPSVAVGYSSSVAVGNSRSVVVGDSPSIVVGDSPSVAVGDSVFVASSIDESIFDRQRRLFNSFFIDMINYTVDISNSQSTYSWEPFKAVTYEVIKVLRARGDAASAVDKSSLEAIEDKAQAAANLKGLIAIEGMLRKRTRRSKRKKIVGDQLKYSSTSQQQQQQQQCYLHGLEFTITMVFFGLLDCPSAASHLVRLLEAGEFFNGNNDPSTIQLAKLLIVVCEEMMMYDYALDVRRRFNINDLLREKDCVP